MPTSLPDSVRNQAGEQVAQDPSLWSAENIRQNVVTRDDRPHPDGGNTLRGYSQVFSRLDGLENQGAGINERLDRVEKQFEGRSE